MMKTLNKIKNFIQLLEKKSFENCIICLERKVDTRLTKCTHVFCLKCLRKWLAEKKVCPLCRLEVEKKIIVNLKDFSHPTKNFQAFWSLLKRKYIELNILLEDPIYLPQSLKQILLMFTFLCIGYITKIYGIPILTNIIAILFFMHWLYSIKIWITDFMENRDV